jgi:hypothetical protein
MSSVGLSVAEPARRTVALTRLAWLHWPRDRWLVATIVLAVVCSVGAWWYAYAHHLTLLYNDAYAHLLIARRVFDNTTPGLAQLGGVWLPLPHVIMLPFIWSDALFQTGMAGSFSSMPCYIAAAIFVFLSARRMTGNSRAAFIGALAFILNPGVLYMQTTPLTEPVLIATMTGACYFFLEWAHEPQPRHLVWAALCTFLSTLTRYDGWFLMVTLLACIVLIDLQRRQAFKQIRDHVMLFGTLSGFGMALWFLWNLLIFHDPLYFQNGPYSSQTQQDLVLQHGQLTTYHNLWQSFRHFLYASAETVGPSLLALAIIGLIIVLVRHKLGPLAIGALPFTAPFVFYVVALYLGQAVLFVPGAAPANASNILYNARYGTEIAAPVAFFLAVLIGRRLVPQLALAGVILTQVVLTAHGGIIALQDGQYGASCAASRPTVDYLASHYAGGLILEDTYFKNPQNYAVDAHLELKDIIYQGSGAIWDQALTNPAATVNWIVVNQGDLVSQHVNLASPAFLAQFAPVAQDSDGVQLYHRIASPLAHNTVDPAVTQAHALCNPATQH